MSVSQLSSSVRSDRSGQPDGEMVDRSWQLDECNSSKAQIRTLLEEQRQTIIAEYKEKVSHHELQAAQAVRLLDSETKKWSPSSLLSLSVHGNVVCVSLCGW